MRTRLAVSIMAVAVLASSAYCGTVTVSPDDMQGWDVVVNKNGLAYFTAGGVAPYETTAGFPSGRGAFYAMCMSGGVSSTDNTPDTVWLGLDTHSGQPLAGVALSQIKTLQYTYYASDMPSYKIVDTEWKYPREPICLQFVVRDDLGNRRNIWFRPWSAVKPQGGGYGGSPATQMGQWVTYDCINCTSQAPGVNTTILPMWNEPQSNQIFHSWTEVCGVYGSWTLVATSTTFDTAAGQYKSPGWDLKTSPNGAVTSTGTGMPLNFEVGARKFAYNGIWGAVANTNWFPESINFRGYVDTFTLGVDLNADGDDADEGENVTYDFEPAAATVAPRPVALNLRSICEGDGDAVVGTTTRTGYAAIWENSNCWKLVMTRLFGQTANVSQLPDTGVPEGIYSEDGVTMSGVYAEMTDGSSGIPVPIKLRIKDPDGSLYDKMQWGGEFIGITGDVRRLPWGLIKARYIWSCAGNVVDYTYIPPE